MCPTDGWREVPPTAGLPLRFGDLLPSHGQPALAEALAEFLAVPAVGLACSGTAAFIVILKTLQRLSPGRRQVVVPAYTCPLVVLAIAHCGLLARVCDVTPGGFELAPEALTELCGGDTLAVVPTHLGGRVADLGPVLAAARACGAYVVEDAAQALGARTGGQSVGLAGEAGFFSLAAGKGLSIFEGGLWVARDSALAAELARTSRETVRSRPLFEAWRSLQLTGLALFYRPALLPYVYGIPLRRAIARGDAAAAVGDVFSPDIPIHRVGRWRQAVGCRALARLPAFQADVAVQGLGRRERLGRLPGVRVWGDAVGNEGVWPFFQLLLPDEAVRDRALAALWGQRLGVTRLFAHALPDYAYLRPWLEPAACPNARDVAARSLSVSNSLWLDEERFARIVAVLAAALEKS